MNRLPLAARWLGYLALFLTFTILRAQDTQVPAPPKVVTAEQALEQLGGTEARLRRQIDVIRKAIDAEVAAGRLTEDAAAQMREAWTIITATRIAKALADTQNVKDNPALAAAYRSMESEWASVQSERLAVLQSAHFDVRNRAIALGRTAQKAQELDAVTFLTERLDRELYTLNPAFAKQENFQQITNFLNGLRRILEELPRDNATALGFALFNWNNNGHNMQSSVAEATVLARADDIYAAMDKEIAEAQKAVESALQANASAEVLTKSSGRLDHAIKRREQARAGFGVQILGEVRVEPGVHAKLVEASLALRGDDSAKSARAVKAAREAAGSAPKSPIVTALLEKWEHELSAAGEQQKKQEQGLAVDRQPELHARIAAAQGPQDLEALAVSFRPDEHSEADSAAISMAVSIVNRLGAMAWAWRRDDPALLGGLGEETSLAASGFATDLNELRARIERQILARRWHAPEINAPPLSQLTPEAAAEKLSDDLAAAGQWRKLLELTENRMVVSGMTRNLTESSAAIRDFIAGQNLEDAEQWTDAANSYKNVLRSTNARAPVKEAASRLKAMQREHAAAFAPPVPAANPSPAAPAK